MLQNIFHFEDGKESFEDFAHENGATHWDESLLMDALGYETQASFSNAINRAKQACLSLNIPCEKHFILQENGTHFGPDSAATC